jgi:hypothetical protein
MTHKGSRGTFTLILNLGIRRRCFISYMPQAALPHAKKPLCPFKRRLGGLQSRPGCSGVEKKIISLPAKLNTKKEPGKKRTA